MRESYAQHYLRSLEHTLRKLLASLFAQLGNVVEYDTELKLELDGCIRLEGPYGTVLEHACQIIAEHSEQLAEIVTSLSELYLEVHAEHYALVEEIPYTLDDIAAESEVYLGVSRALCIHRFHIGCERIHICRRYGYACAHGYLACVGTYRIVDIQLEIRRSREDIDISERNVEYLNPVILAYQIGKYVAEYFARDLQSDYTVVDSKSGEQRVDYVIACARCAFGDLIAVLIVSDDCNRVIFVLVIPLGCKIAARGYFSSPLRGCSSRNRQGYFVVRRALYAAPRYGPCDIVDCNVYSYGLLRLVGIYLSDCECKFIYGDILARDEYSYLIRYYSRSVCGKFEYSAFDDGRRYIDVSALSVGTYLRYRVLILAVIYVPRYIGRLDIFTILSLRAIIEVFCRRSSRDDYLLVAVLKRAYVYSVISVSVVRVDNHELSVDEYRRIVMSYAHSDCLYSIGSAVYAGRNAVYIVIYIVCLTVSVPYHGSARIDGSD